MHDDAPRSLYNQAQSQDENTATTSDVNIAGSPLRHGNPMVSYSITSLPGYPAPLDSMNDSMDLCTIHSDDTTMADPTTDAPSDFFSSSKDDFGFDFDDLFPFSSTPEYDQQYEAERARPLCPPHAQDVQQTMHQAQLGAHLTGPCMEQYQPFRSMHDGQKLTPMAAESIENHSLQNQTIHQRQVAIAPRSFHETSLSSNSVEHSHEQGLRESSPSVSHIETDHPAGTEIVCQERSKRPRRALALHKRVDIIRYWERYPDMSITAISKELKVARTTIDGIIKNRDTLMKREKYQLYRGLDSGRCSIIESRYRVLEVLLVEWCLDLKSRRGAVTNQKIMAQAFEIRRMLSRLLLESLPPCLFTSGWLQKFKKRKERSLAKAQASISTIPQDDGWVILNGHQGDIVVNMDDLYICGITSMYLSMLPSSTYDTLCHGSTTDIQDSPIVTVLLCCNATFTDRVKPTLSVRHNGGGLNVTDGLEDLTAQDVKAWLLEINAELSKTSQRENAITLVMEPSVWGLFQPSPERAGEQVESLESIATTLKNIVLVKAPTTRVSSLPVAAGLAQELKHRYLHRGLTLRENPELRVKGQVMDITTDCEDVCHAWNNVQGSSATRNNFKSIVESLKGQLGSRLSFPTQDMIVDSGWVSQPFQGSDDADFFLGSEVADADAEAEDHENFDIEKFAKIFKPLVKSLFPDMPKEVIQYYIALDSDVGPSSFLRAKIQEMRDHDDFKGCFGPLNFGRVTRDIPWTLSIPATRVIRNNKPFSTTKHAVRRHRTLFFAK